MSGLTRLWWACVRGGVALMLVACTPSASTGAVRLCSPTDLSLTARWQGATGALAGGLRLEVTAPTGCALPGQLQVELVDAQGQALLINELAAPAFCDDPQAATGCLSQTTVEVEPGQSALVRLVWQNWCGPPPSGSVGVEITLPAEPQPLSAPIVDAAGTSSVDTPRCDAPAAPSTLAVGPVEVWLSSPRSQSMGELTFEVRPDCIAGDADGTLLAIQFAIGGERCDTSAPLSIMAALDLVGVEPQHPSDLRDRPKTTI